MRLQDGERNSQGYMTYASRVKGDTLIHTFCKSEKDSCKRNRTEIICIQVLTPKVMPHYFSHFGPKFEWWISPG